MFRRPHGTLPCSILFVEVGADRILDFFGYGGLVLADQLFRFLMRNLVHAGRMGYISASQANIRALEKLVTAEQFHCERIGEEVSTRTSLGDGIQGELAITGVDASANIFGHIN